MAKKQFPDLNKDGKVTQADILQGRGVNKKRGGGKVNKGMAVGGKVKKGMAVGGKVKKGMAVGGKVKKGMAVGGKVKKGYSMGGALGSAPPIMPGSSMQAMESDEDRKKRMMRQPGGMPPKMPGMNKGGAVGGKKGMSKGGKIGGKKKATKAKATKAKTTTKRKPKVRGAGIARKGVRPAKMR